MKQVFHGYRITKDGYFITPKGKYIRGHYKAQCSGAGRVPKYYWAIKFPGLRPSLVHRLFAINFVENKYPDVCTHVDHIDGNSLNNRSTNLRFCTLEINNLNKKNTPKRTPSGKWMVQCCGKYLGRHETEAKARQVVADFKMAREKLLWEKVAEQQRVIDMFRRNSVDDVPACDANGQSTPKKTCCRSESSSPSPQSPVSCKLSPTATATG